MWWAGWEKEKKKKKKRKKKKNQISPGFGNEGNK
jgi:hypothetical protein